jgi:DNA-binding SARP family transcriptional activator
LQSDRTSVRLVLLGPVRAWRKGSEVPVRPPKQRAVLALLASRANDVVTFEQIVDAVWGDAVPRTAANGVHTYIAGLRRVFEPERGSRHPGEIVASAGGGYVLQIAREAIDTEVFLGCIASARQLSAGGERDGAIEAFDSALGLWHGDAYANVPGPFAALERTRLHELRMTAVEEWATLMAATGRHLEVIPAVSDAVAKDPLREKLRWLLMLALYRCARRADALAVYRRTWRLLQEELGVEPGPALQSLHEKILRGDPHIEAPAQAESPRNGNVPRPRERLRICPRPAQLPPCARGFAGRSQELSWLESVLSLEESTGAATARVVLIDGTAGVGKTALALQVAHDLSGCFSDGQLYVDLAGFSPHRGQVSAAEALGLLLTGLGVDRAHIPPDLTCRTALYRSLLHDRKVLIVLDDAHSAEQVRPLIPPGPASVLITSRCWLGGLVAREGAHRLGLLPLAPEESIDLLAGLVGPARMAGRRNYALRLAHLCGYLPLALRITAESLIADPALQLPQLVLRYRDPRTRLDHLTVAEDASLNMRIALAASYEDLPREAARMFRLVGRSGSAVITVSEASALAGCPPTRAARQLNLLARRHMLERDGGFAYRLPPLLRIYVAECAEA